MNQTEFKELEKYLPGLKPDMPEVYKKLAEIMKYQVFELYSDTDENERKSYYMPYMMNDALECYLILENCRITGKYLSEFKGEMTGYLAENDGSVALIVRQGENNVFTLWFEEIKEEMRCYQYHQIGHFWVKGQEHWRQLVYIIGTIYDKYEYLGDSVCTDKEKELLPLMEFAPFRKWSPIKESLDEKYQDTIDGVRYMELLALEAGDRIIKMLLKYYQKNPFLWIKRLIEYLLCSRNGKGIYEIIWKKVETASLEYSQRDYGEKLNTEIVKQRQEITEILESRGFCGTYPFFQRGRVQIVAAEEHPFTILEAEDFNFRIQFMVSVSKDDSKIRNSGFFKGRKNRGWIEKDLEFLENLK